MELEAPCTSREEEEKGQPSRGRGVGQQAVDKVQFFYLGYQGFKMRFFKKRELARVSTERRNKPSGSSKPPSCARY
jgi:hypothetical protein